MKKAALILMIVLFIAALPMMVMAKAVDPRGPVACNTNDAMQMIDDTQTMMALGPPETTMSVMDTGAADNYFAICAAKMISGGGNLQAAGPAWSVNNQKNQGDVQFAMAKQNQLKGTAPPGIGAGVSFTENSQPNNMIENTNIQSENDGSMAAISTQRTVEGSIGTSAKNENNGIASTNTGMGIDAYNDAKTTGRWTVT